jgi:hypothetical protein
MPSIEQTSFKPAKLLATTSATNAVCTAQKTAGARVQNYITAICISASAAPAAAVQATLTINGTAIPIQLPAAAFAPIFINFAKAALEGDVGETVSLSVPALGAAVICTVTLYGFQAGS